MANNKFLDNFLEFLRTAGSLTKGILAGESMHYLDMRVGGHDPHKIYKGFRNMRDRKIVRELGRGRYIFTGSGRQWLKHKTAGYFKNQQKIWDHKWRVVLFDIPQEISGSRRKFRGKLLSIGFRPIQKSVFVFPYPCEEEVSMFARSLNVNDYVDMMITESPGFKEKELLKLFEL